MRPLLVALAMVVTVLPPASAAPLEVEVVSARDGRVVAESPPTVSGTPAYHALLRADGGTWTPDDVALSYRWLRDGEPVRGARGRSYRIRLADLGHRLGVRVTATDAEGHRGFALSEPTARVVRAKLASRRPPAVLGEARFTRTLAARPGRWSAPTTRLSYRWLRGGTPIAGATAPRYRIVPADVGRRVRVEVTAYADGHRPATARSAPVRARHRVAVRRTVTYRVETRGRITTSLREFRGQAQETFADPRGWRGTGVRFRPVASGGSFTLVLAEASTVPGFSSGCSSYYSCRVGRFVIINQDRWRSASPPWNAAGRSVRDYRHMVVNHELGHWLGRGHASCPTPGALAPVMMQQSKGTDGCRFNPWPTAGELR